MTELAGDKGEMIGQEQSCSNPSNSTSSRRRVIVWFITTVLVVLGVLSTTNSFASTTTTSTSIGSNRILYDIHTTPAHIQNIQNIEIHEVVSSDSVPPSSPHTHTHTHTDTHRQLSSNSGTTSSQQDTTTFTYDFTKALQQINKITNLIYQRFEFHNYERYQFFLESQNMPMYGWDLIKYKLALKLLSPQPPAKEDPLYDIVINNTTFSKEYLMIFGGSSVTAGHDNYYNQSYPFVFERRMKEIMQLFGLDLVVHNIAQGSNNCRPSDYCYEAMGGDNPDWISWEQSFNCGRSRDIMEMMARIAYWNKAVVYYVASGAFLTNGCAKTTDKLYWTSEWWTPESEGITNKYEVTPEKTAIVRQNASSWYDDGNAVSRFTVQVYGGIYKGVGPHGFSVWGHSSSLCNNGKGCTAIDVKGECLEKGGPHWMVAETSYYAEDPNRSGKSWHPPTGMHLLRGEVLAYTFAHIVADTIYMLQNDSKGMTKDEMFNKYLTEWNALRVPIPEKGLHLGIEDSNPMKCYTNFRPHFNPKYTLSGLILGNHTQWKYIDRNEFPAHERQYGYNDTRPFYEATGPNHEIHLRIKNVRSGAIRVCGYSHKESLSHALFFLDPHYPFPDNTTPNSEIEYKETSKRIHVEDVGGVGDECMRLGTIPLGGDHVLTIRTDPNHPLHTASLTHVIVF